MQVKAMLGLLAGLRHQQSAQYSTSRRRHCSEYISATLMELR